MKKSITIPFILSLTLYSFSSTVDFSSSVFFSLPLKNNSIEKKTSTIKYNYGLKLNLTNTTLVSNCKLASTKIIDLCDYNFNDFISNQEYTYGFNYLRKTEKLNFEFISGTLKFSNSISRLKNPTYTCPSALKTFSVFTIGIAPNLPTNSSGVSPLSCATTISPKSNIMFFPTIQLAILETGEKYASIYKKISTSINFEILFSLCCGSFIHEYNKKTGWFQTQRYYKKSEYFAGEYTTAFLWKQFKTSYAVGLYENPFGGTNRWIKNNSYLNIGIFSLGAYCFFCDEDLITTSGNLPKIKKQFFLTPQLNFALGKGISTFGMSVGETIKKANLINSNNHYYIKAATSYSTINYNIKFFYNTDYSTLTKKQNKQYNLTTSIPINSMKLNSNILYSYTNEKSKNYKISEKVFFNESVLEYIAVTWSLTENLNNDKWNFDTSASFSKKTKNISFKGKISFSFRKTS